MPNPTPAPDPYAILEVSPRASAEAIKGAYFGLIDPNNANPIDSKSPRYATLMRAYNLLSDPVKRAAYDEARANSFIGPYRIIGEIAEGGFGTTYRAEHPITGEAVCIKHCSAIDSAAHDAVLIQEATILGTLRHFALPSMRDILRLDDGSLALVMSFIEGPTLEQVVEKVGPMDPETVGWITERLLNALLFLHRFGVIHGDLKPQNIIIQPEEHAVVLVDFGLSQSKPTAKTKGKGYTEFFAPPEQLALKPLIPASDFFSLGQCMIYALGGGMDAVKKVEVPTTVPDPICRFIKKITAKHPLDRPQGDLFDAFRAIRMKAFGQIRSGMKPIPGL